MVLICSLWIALVYVLKTAQAQENNCIDIISPRYERNLLYKCRDVKFRSTFTNDFVPGVSPQGQRFHIPRETPYLSFEVHSSDSAANIIMDAGFGFMSKAACGQIWFELFSCVSKYLTTVSSNLFQRGIEIRSDQQKNYVDDFLSELRHINGDIQRVMWQVSKLEFEHDNDKCFKPTQSMLKYTITTSQSCDQAGLSCRFGEMFERFWCLAEYLEYSPLEIDLKPGLVQSLETALTNISRRFDDTPSSAFASGAEAIMPARLDITNEKEVRYSPILFFVGRYLGNYGHMLLDNLFSVFVHLTAHDLRERPLVIMVADTPDPENEWEIGGMFDQVARTVCNPLAVAWVDVLSMQVLSSGEPLHWIPATVLDPVAGEVLEEDLRRRFLRDGATPDRVYASARRSPLLRSYVGRIVGRLALEHVAPVPLLFTMALRSGSRRLLNHVEVRAVLQRLGYRVEVADFAAMSFREQVLLMLRSSALLSAYGANLANSVFLRSGTRAVVLWPNPDARGFWAERSCLLHACALALGVVIQAVDKPYYDSLDRWGQREGLHPLLPVCKRAAGRHGVTQGDSAARHCGSRQPSLLCQT